MVPRTGHLPWVGMRDEHFSPESRKIQMRGGGGGARRSCRDGWTGPLELPSRASAGSYHKAGEQVHLHPHTPGLPRLLMKGLSCGASPFWQGGVEEPSVKETYFTEWGLEPAT